MGLGFGAYFQSTGSELSLSRTSNYRIFFRFGYHVFTLYCPAYEIGDQGVWMTLRRANCLVPAGKVYFTSVALGKVTVKSGVGSASCGAQGSASVEEVSATLSVP